MKKLLTILLGVIAISCSSDDDSIIIDNVSQDTVVSVDVNDLVEGFYKLEANGNSYNLTIKESRFSLTIFRDVPGKLLIIDKVKDLKFSELSNGFCRLNCYELISIKNSRIQIFQKLSGGDSFLIDFIKQ